MIPARASRVGLSPSSEAAHLVGLMTQIRGRQQTALGELYDLTVGRAFAVAMRVLANPNDAEEAVCSAYQQVWEQAQSYDPQRGGVGGWLTTIVWTRALDLARRRRPHASLDDVHPNAGHLAYTAREDDCAHSLDAFMAGSAVRHALQALKPVSRKLLDLAFVAGLSHQEIAAQTGLPLGTVKSHIRRALAELRKLLDAGGYGHD